MQLLRGCISPAQCVPLRSSSLLSRRHTGTFPAWLRTLPRRGAALTAAPQQAARQRDLGCRLPSKGPRFPLACRGSPQAAVALSRLLPPRSHSAPLLQDAPAQSLTPVRDVLWLTRGARGACAVTYPPPSPLFSLQRGLHAASALVPDCLKHPPPPLPLACSCDPVPTESSRWSSGPRRVSYSHSHTP